MEKKLEGKKCPKFSGDCTGDKYLSNDDFIGKNIVIYFYRIANVFLLKRPAME